MEDRDLGGKILSAYLLASIWRPCRELLTRMSFEICAGSEEVGTATADALRTHMLLSLPELRARHLRQVRADLDAVLRAIVEVKASPMLPTRIARKN